MAVAIISSNLPVLRPLLVKNSVTANSYQSSYEDRSKKDTSWSISKGKRIEAEERPFAKMACIPSVDRLYRASNSIRG